MDYIYRDTHISIAFESNFYLNKILRIFDSLLVRESAKLLTRGRYSISVDTSKICCHIENSEWQINVVNESDIYTIVYLFLYSVWCENKQFGVHGVSIKKDTECILLLGKFGAGKTTLSWEFQKLGWKVVSADQCIISFRGCNMFLEHGSKYAMYQGTDTVIESSSSPCLIDKVLSIKGLAHNGETDIKVIKNKAYGVKELWSYATWPWNTLLLGEFRQSEFFKERYFAKLAQLNNFYNINYFEVRGDPAEIASQITVLWGKQNDLLTNT